jgi:beta-lactamase superfamily II metal-dependent hydrolase
VAGVALRVIVFDVGHGDSIVVEVCSTPPQWMIVDCCLVKDGAGGYRSPAYEYVQARGVVEINTLIVTHLHQDHYAGVELFLENMKINRLIFPPYLSRNQQLMNQALNRIKAELRGLVRRSADPRVVKPAFSLVKLIDFIRNNEDVVSEAHGPRQVCTLSSTPKVDFTMHLPLPGVKGLIHRRIADDFTLNEAGNHNQASIALTLELNGRAILMLGADSECGEWAKHEEQSKRDRITSLSCPSMKVPHHGSRHNNTLAVLRYVAGTEPSPTLLVSADGVKHPHDEFFELVNSTGSEPYCTNLALQCQSPSLERFPEWAGVPNEARPFASNYARSRFIQCQGDIVFEVDLDGEVNVSATRALSCPYRPSKPARRISLPLAHA